MIKDEKTFSILVVEDNFIDFKRVEQLIMQLDLSPEIQYAKNFEEVSSILSSDANFFDVVLLDLTLPDISAQNLINDMVDRVLSCPIILLASNAEVDFSVRSISQGISDYLIKEGLTAAILYKSVSCAIARKKTFFLYDEARTRYSDLFHLSPLAMWVYDLGTFYFLDVNEAAIKKYGYTKAEFLKITIKDIWPEEDYPIFDEGVHSFSQYRDSIKKRHLRHQKKNGYIIDVEVKSNIIYFKSQKVKLVMVNDITKQIQYIKTIENQNKSLTDIAWTHSHSVRAPLAKMMSIIDFIKESDEIPDEFEELLGCFFDSGIELDTIIRDIVRNTETNNGNKIES